MIQKISFGKNYLYSNQVNSQSKNNDGIDRHDKKKIYTDSFIKHTKKSVPMLLALTAVKSLFDYGSSNNNSVQKVFASNMACFFTPILIGSSLVLSLVENRKVESKKLNFNK